MSKRSARQPRMAMFAGVLSLTALACGGDRAAARTDVTEARSLGAECQGTNDDYLVAMGGGLTYGITDQTTRATPLSGYNQGYVDDFAARLHATKKGAGTQVVNFACPMDTVAAAGASYINGPCAWHALGLPTHADYKGSQLEAAETFLLAHKGQVGTILIDLGRVDVISLVDDPACGDNLTDAEWVACLRIKWPPMLAEIRKGVKTILSRVRHAAPCSQIIALQIPNQYAKGHFVLDGTVSEAESFRVLDFIFKDLNGVVAESARQVNAETADLFAVFNANPTSYCLLSRCEGGGEKGETTVVGHQKFSDVAWFAFQRAAGGRR